LLQGIPLCGILVEIPSGGIILEIISYGARETKDFDLKGKLTNRCRWRAVDKIARRKLDILIYGASIDDFKVPPGNKFEWLKGDLKGFASIRINDQWRIIFKVNKLNQLEDVEIIDYHR
jgi:proteic killer suppression protein